MVINMADAAMRTEMQARGTRLDVSRLVGTWFAVKLDDNRIAKLVITEQDGTLLIHPYGPSDSELPDWGQVAADPHTASGSTTATGFQARYRVGAMRVEFLVVENQGVLLVQHFTSFDDGRANEFGKAYYRRSAPELVTTVGISTGAVTGEWVNAKPDTQWATRFILAENAGAMTIRVWCATDPIDWGEAEVTTHRDSQGEQHFFAEYDLEPFEAVVGVLSIKNLVVVNQLRRFKGGESPSLFCREFFFRNR
jgi:hypothetical protein